MKKFFVVFAAGVIGLLVWLAAGPDKTPAPNRMAHPTTTTTAPPQPPPEPAVSAEVLAPILTATAAPMAVASDTAPTMRDADSPRPMIVPVEGIARRAMRDMFNEVRGSRRHEAIDILAPRGTPVIATDDGFIKKLFTSVPGGLTIYEFDPDQRFCYYYAHLDRYAAGIREGQTVHQGEVLGYVGTTGNAPKDTPHLHFALIRLDLDRRWWKGTYVNPYPFLAR